MNIGYSNEVVVLWFIRKPVLIVKCGINTYVHLQSYYTLFIAIFLCTYTYASHNSVSKREKALSQFMKLARFVDIRKQIEDMCYFGRISRY